MASTTCIRYFVALLVGATLLLLSGALVFAAGKASDATPLGWPPIPSPQTSTGSEEGITLPEKVTSMGIASTQAIHDWSGLTPDGRHFGYVKEGDDGRFHLILDGAEVEGPEPAYPFYVAFSPDSKRMAYVAVGKDRVKRGVVLDGVQGSEYDGILDLVFSPDGKRLAYIACRGEKQLVVVDGVEGKEYDEVDRLVFSPDGKRFAYQALHEISEMGPSGYEGTRTRACAVIDGVEVKRYLEEPAISQLKILRYEATGCPAFSPDSKRVAYVAWFGDGSACVVVDDVESEPYWGIQDPPVFSPDSKRVAFVVSNGESFVVVDGVKQKAYSEIHGLRFSANSKHVIYRAWTDEGKDVLVRDGVEISRGDSPIFGPDGKRTAYVKRRAEKMIVVVDGVEGEEYDEIVDDPVFSADGKRMAYVAWRGGKALVVVDGVEGKEYNAASKLTFSPDGKHVAYFARSDWKYFAVVDGVEGERYDCLLMGTTLVFDGPSRFRFFVAREAGPGKSEPLRVDVQIVGP